MKAKEKERKEKIWFIQNFFIQKPGMWPDDKEKKIKKEGTKKKKMKERKKENKHIKSHGLP